MLSIISFQKTAIEWSRSYRSKMLSPIVMPLHKLGISPYVLTLLSFALGIAAAYFVFDSHQLFIFFAMSHLVLDGLDGVLARISGETKLGGVLDHASDHFLVVLLLINMFFTFDVAIALIIAGLSAIHIALHYTLDLPVIYSRLVILFFFFLKYYHAGMAAVGILTVFGLLSQLYHLTLLRSKK